jgi:hypothetical protein
MADYTIGYGKPPKQFQFKSGVSPNPRGRPPKPKPTALADVIRSTLTAPIQYREHGRTKTTTRLALGLKMIVDSAVKGDLAAAELILAVRAQALRSGDAGIDLLEIHGGLPDFSGQTAEAKTAVMSTEEISDPAKE